MSVYDNGHQEGYIAGYQKGWNDCEFKQKGAVKALESQLEELRKGIGLSALEDKVCELEMQVKRAGERIGNHKACDCELCVPDWKAYE